MEGPRRQYQPAASGKASIPVVLGLLFGVVLMLLLGALLLPDLKLDGDTAKEVQPEPPADRMDQAPRLPPQARPAGPDSGESIARRKTDLQMRRQQESAATESFRRAQSEYRSSHTAARDAARMRQSDARRSAVLSAGTRMQLAASELSSWVFSYPEPVSIAVRINGGEPLQSLSQTLEDWYEGLGERVDALAAAECAMAAAAGGRRDRSLSVPPMLSLTKSKGELREPTPTRLAGHFGLDANAAEWLAAQLRPRWREANRRIDDGLARIEQARNASLTAGEKEQLLFNGQIRMARAIDGDTIEILVRDKFSDAEFTDRVRLLNVDTPEIGTPGANEATNLVERECQGDLTLEFERPGQLSRDKYGRVLAFVFAERTFVNAKLIERGHSKFYSEYGEGRYAQYFRYLEGVAALDPN
jgi:endonuclease YncB( thermonuclease family)